MPARCEKAETADISVGRLVGLLRGYSNLGDQVGRLHRLVHLPVRDVADCHLRPVKMRRYLTAGDEADLLKAYEAGATLRRLASRWGINREKVSLILEAHGVTRRYHSTVTVDLNRAADLEAEGLNLTEIASAMGVGRTTLIRARRAVRQREG